MKHFFFAIVCAFLFSNNILSEPYNVFITKVKVVTKNKGKYWDTFRGAPDIQVIVSKKENENWKKIFTSKVYTNYYIVDETIVIDVKFRLGDEVIIEIVDRDFRRNDSIGSHMFTIKESKDMIAFSMVEEMSYTVTRYDSVESREKAKDDLEWQRLQDAKKKQQTDKKKELKKWQEYKKEMRKELEEELKQTKKNMLEELKKELKLEKEIAQEKIKIEAIELRSKMKVKLADEEKQKNANLTTIKEKLQKAIAKWEKESIKHEEKQKKTKEKSQNKIDEKQKVLQDLLDDIENAKVLLEELEKKIERKQAQLDKIPLFKGPNAEKISPQRIVRAIRAVELTARFIRTKLTIKDTQQIKEMLLNIKKLSFFATEKYKELEEVAQIYAKK